MAQIPDMNGDGFRELVVGAPLEDDHQGAIYVFHGQDKSIQPQYKQVHVDWPLHTTEKDDWMGNKRRKKRKSVSFLV